MSKAMVRAMRALPEGTIIRVIKFGNTPYVYEKQGDEWLSPGGLRVLDDETVNDYDEPWRVVFDPADDRREDYNE